MRTRAWRWGHALCVLAFVAVLGACVPDPTSAPVEVAAAHEYPPSDPAVAPSLEPRVLALGADVKAHSEFQPGEHVLQAVVGGVTRQWTIVVPASRSLSNAAPLLVVLHGVGGRGSAMRTLGFDARAASAGVIVAYPDAYNGSWNDGRPGLETLAGSPVDDVAFLRTLIDETVWRAGGDPNHVAMLGFSNGAMMTSRAACDITDRLAAVAMVSGAGPQDIAAKCHPMRALPLEVVFGTADRIVPYAGGPVAPFNGKQRGISASVTELLGLWSLRDGCNGFSEKILAGTNPAVTEVRGTSCADGQELVHLRHAGGHEWIHNTTFDTTAHVWDFVRAHLLDA